MLIMGNLNERQARALVRIDDVELRLNAIEKVVTKNLDLKQTEELVDQLLKGSPKREKKQRKKLPITAPPRLYMNSLNALLKRIKEDKIPCELTTEKSDRFYEYTIKFPINI